MKLSTMQSLVDNFDMTGEIDADAGTITIFSRRGVLLGVFSLETGTRI